MSSLCIIAGELSGDTHAAGLISALRQQNPDTTFWGLGGPKMQTAAGPESKIEDWVATAGVVGLWEVLKMYSYFKKQLQDITARILQQQPPAVILVDYPGFNLRLASALRQSGYRGKLIYYISPQVWAWKKGRVKTMARVLDLMICIFPFEKDFYEASGLSTVFAGHPITALTQQPDLPPREPNLIGFFPGSRKTEVRRLLPILLSTATQLQSQQPDLRFVISAANQSLATLIREIATSSGQPQAADWIQIGNSRQLMQTCTAGAVASGTATLEAAASGLPYVLIYHVNWLTYFVGKSVVKIKHLGIVNILAGRTVVEELIQHQLTPTALSQSLHRLATDPDARQQLQDQLAQTIAQLGPPGAYPRAAQAITALLSPAS